ncbi:hypothetical protein [Lacihabitans soyangensis]|jgi:hypothetical protein|uniref:Uncharacterized protein n=1 Tax=Lacihabitans soyangensis TaxID=869394 RepID=A0AAE3KSP9_9BACT|nr:hypothetical protein [Lacihabitans soyangensis]MCP9761466.1 hypothetical protein [Lacihabitans soyangensis]
MDSDFRKSYLELKVIWKDDDVLELSVKVSNGRYSGITEVYDTPETLFNFARRLEGYPSVNQELFYEAGKKDSYSFFSMRFYKIDSAGQIGVEIMLEENVSTEYRPEEKDKLKVEIIIVPSAIDDFQKELVNMAKNREGVSILNGQYNYS